MTGTTKLARILILILAVAAQCACAASRNPTPSPTPPPVIEESEAEYNATQLQRLAAVSPAAVPTLRSVIATTDPDQIYVARNGLAQVLEMAPDFPDALRRLAIIEADLRQFGPSLEHARKAVRLDQNGHTTSALAYVLLQRGGEADFREALPLARMAARLRPDDEFAQLTLLGVAWEAGDTPRVREATSALLRLTPARALPHFTAGILATYDRDWELAEGELLKARALGYPADQVQIALDDRVADQAAIRRRLISVGQGIGAWAAGSAALFALTFLLNALMLRSLKLDEAGSYVSTMPAAHPVRLAYRVVIALLAADFGIALLLVLILLIGSVIGLTTGNIVSSIVALPALFLVGALVLAAIRQRRRGISMRRLLAQIRKPLSTTEAPALWALSRAAAEQVRVEPAAGITLRAGAYLKLGREAGAIPAALGFGRRALDIGMGSLEGLTQVQLAALVARLYAGDSSRDPSGGGLVRRLESLIDALAEPLMQAGIDGLWNPIWLVMYGFAKLFYGVTTAASREHEMLADRASALAFGGQNCISGLIHLIVRQHVLSPTVWWSLEKEREMGIGTPNFYTQTVLPEPEQRRMDAEVEVELARETHPHDNQLAPRDRIRFLQQFPSLRDAGIGIGPAWELLPNPETIQIEMTSRIRDAQRRAVRW